MLFGKRKIRAAIKARDAARLAILLNRSPRLANVTVSALGGEEQSPLHFAAAGGSWDVESIFASMGGGFSHEHDDADLAMARLLIEHGAIVNCADEHGQMPLHFACARGRQALVELLLDSGAHIDARNYDYHAPPLEYALHYGQDDVAAVLVRRGAGLTYHAGDKPRGPVIAACEAGCLLALRAMVERGADIKEGDSIGDLPLHWAARTGRTEIVRDLIALGANVNAEGGYSLTPLHLAASKGQCEVTELLLASHADVNALSDIRQTPLHMTVGYGVVSTARILVNKGAEVNAVDRSGVTPLHMAAAQGRSDLVSLLIEAGAHVNVANAKGDTPAKWAHDKQFSDVVALLQSHGGCL